MIGGRIFFICTVAVRFPALSKQAVILSGDSGDGVFSKPVLACSDAVEYEIAHNC
jgi:hypothetical protein